MSVDSSSATGGCSPCRRARSTGTPSPGTPAGPPSLPTSSCRSYCRNAAKFATEFQVKEDMRVKKKYKKQSKAAKKKRPPFFGPKVPVKGRALRPNEVLDFHDSRFLDPPEELRMNKPLAEVELERSTSSVRLLPGDPSDISKLVPDDGVGLPKHFQTFDAVKADGEAPKQLSSFEAVKMEQNRAMFPTFEAVPTVPSRQGMARKQEKARQKIKLKGFIDRSKDKRPQADQMFPFPPMQEISQGIRNLNPDQFQTFAPIREEEMRPSQRPFAAPDVPSESGRPLSEPFMTDMHFNVQEPMKPILRPRPAPMEVSRPFPSPPQMEEGVRSRPQFNPPPPFPPDSGLRQPPLPSPPVGQTSFMSEPFSPPTPPKRGKSARTRPSPFNSLFELEDDRSTGSGRPIIHHMQAFAQSRFNLPKQPPNRPSPLPPNQRRGRPRRPPRPLVEEAEVLRGGHILPTLGGHGGHALSFDPLPPPTRQDGDTPREAPPHNPPTAQPVFQAFGRKPLLDVSHNSLEDVDPDLISASSPAPFPHHQRRGRLRKRPLQRPLRVSTPRPLVFDRTPSSLTDINSDVVSSNVFGRKHMGQFVVEGPNYSISWGG